MFNELLKKAEKASYGEKSKLAWKIFWMVILIEAAMFGSGEIQEFSPYAYKRAD